MPRPTPGQPSESVDVAESYDTAARLAQGLPGVSDIERYVAACHALGYQHPDLTAHAAQVRQWYTGEDGMNLVALEADCAALRTASAVIDQALARQDAQRVTLAAAWQGAGGQATQDFLTRHGASAAATAAAVRSAAHNLADLRDRLWQAVDGKVATALTIDGGAQARRGDWLAAAHSVTTGAGDRAVASELVDQEVKPFVDNVIGQQWLSAMREAVEAIEAAYDAATAELASRSGVAFEVPGELGPTWTSASDTGSPGAPSSSGVPAIGGVAVPPSATAAPPGGMAVYPAALAPAPAPPVSAAAPPAAPPTVPATLPPTDPAGGAGMAAPIPPSLGGGGLPDIGSGLSSFGQQLGDLFGGLLGAGDLGSPELADSDALEDIDEVEDIDALEEADEELEKGSGGLDEDTEQGDSELDDEPVNVEGDEGEQEPVDAAAETCAPETPPADPVGAPLDQPAPTQPPAPPVVPPEPPAIPPEPLAAPAEPLAAPPQPLAEPTSGTPCEIAADELPQVGE